jgi:hypothetical protein
MLSPSLPMSLHARRSPSGQAHSEPRPRHQDWKIAAVKTQSMYCIALRNKFDKTIIGCYDASASNFSTDQRRAKLFLDRVDADLVTDQLRRMYPRLTQDIEVTPVQPTALIYSSDRPSRVAMIWCCSVLIRAHRCLRRLSHFAPISQSCQCWRRYECLRWVEDGSFSGGRRTAGIGATPSPHGGAATD